MMHGHTKIELTNVHTGEVEVIEKDNIVTNAVNQIFNGPGSQINAQRLLRKGDLSCNTLMSQSLVGSFYGGLLLYDKALGSDPNTFFAPADAHIVGCGVYDKGNTGLNKFRGSCNKLETKIDTEEGVATFVYDFATSQANGTIASVCLTNILGGYMSETPGTMTYGDGSDGKWYTQDWDGSIGASQYLYSGDSGIVGSRISENYGRPVYLDTENDIIVFAQLTSDKKLIVRKMQAETRTINLFQNAAKPYPVVDTKEYDVSSLVQSTATGYDYVKGRTDAAGYNRVFCDIERQKWYLTCAPSNGIVANAKVNIREFDMTSEAFKDYSIINTTGEQLVQVFSSFDLDDSFSGHVYDGCLYLCGYNAPYQIYRIPLSDPTNATKIKMNGLTMMSWGDAHDGRIYCYRTWQKFGSNYYDASALPGVILNTDTNELYQMEAREYLLMGSNYGSPSCIPMTGNSILTLANMSYSYTGGGTTTHYPHLRLGIRRNYLGTINDLPSPVEKTADKTMKITYTLRRS